MEEKLIVVDPLVQGVSIHIYPIDEDMDIDESVIKKLGHDPNTCQWFFGLDVNIIKHNDYEVAKILH